MDKTQGNGYISQKLNYGNRRGFQKMHESDEKLLKDARRPFNLGLNEQKEDDSPFKMTNDEYWYKVDGKNVTLAEYKAAHAKGIHDPSSPNFTDGSGLQTNHPDVHGYKAARKKAHEERNKNKKKEEDSPLQWDWKDTLDATQTGLTAAGMVPVIGNIADAVNVGLSGARAGYAKLKGDKKSMKEHLKSGAINAAAMVPGAGLAVGGAKLAAKAAKGVNVANAVKAVRAGQGVAKVAKTIRKGDKVTKDLTKYRNKGKDLITGVAVDTAQQKKNIKKDKNIA